MFGCMWLGGLGSSWIFRPWNGNFMNWRFLKSSYAHCIHFEHDFKHFKPMPENSNEPTLGCWIVLNRAGVRYIFLILQQCVCGWLAGWTGHGFHWETIRCCPRVLPFHAFCVQPRQNFIPSTVACLYLPLGLFPAQQDRFFHGGENWKAKNQDFSNFRFSDFFGPKNHPVLRRKNRLAHCFWAVLINPPQVPNLGWNNFDEEVMPKSNDDPWKCNRSTRLWIFSIYADFNRGSMMIHQWMLKMAYF